ncbi:MAG: HEAT repeat domain-containing protein, partial [Cyanobacteria bacterium J06639_18]
MSKIRPEVAQRRIKSFFKRFGETHLYLAYHAAFPLALKPELLYNLWANFQQDIHGKLLNIPWIGVADLLLSNLCDEVGYELYEMDLAVRNELLKELQSNERFGQQRIKELSDFLLEYIQNELQSPDP